MEKTKGNNRKEQRRQLELYLVVAVKNIDHSKSGSRAQKTVQGVNKDILTN